MADVLDIENSEEFEVDEDGERTYFAPIYWYIHSSFPSNGLSFLTFMSY